MYMKSLIKTQVIIIGSCLLHVTYNNIRHLKSCSLCRVSDMLVCIISQVVGFLHKLVLVTKRWKVEDAAVKTGGSETFLKVMFLRHIL